MNLEDLDPQQHAKVLLCQLLQQIIIHGIEPDEIKGLGYELPDGSQLIVRMRWKPSHEVIAERKRQDEGGVRLLPDPEEAN